MEDLQSTVVDLEIRLITQAKMMDFLINNNHNLVRPSQADIKRFEDESFLMLQKKHPNLRKI